MSRVDLNWLNDLIKRYKTAQIHIFNSSKDIEEKEIALSKAVASDEILSLIMQYIKDINNITNPSIEIKKK